MPDLEFDYNTKKATAWLRRGGEVARSATINLNTVNYDNGGKIISVVFPSATATMNLAGLGLTTQEHDAIVSLGGHHAFLSKKTAG